MTVLETAEAAVRGLTKTELPRFREWFAEFDGDLWDAQIESDAVGGRLDALAEEALADFRSGRSSEL